MKGSFRKRGCKCPKEKRCTCGATWSFRIDVTDPKTGKRMQPEFTGYSTRKEAELACATKIIEIETGTYVANTKILFKDFADDWLKEYMRSKKESSVRIRTHEKNMLLKYFAYANIIAITKKQYQEALDDLFAAGYSDSTISGVHGTARMIFKAAKKDGLIKADPSEYAVVPKKQKSVEELESEDEVVKYLEKEELALLLKTAKEKGKNNDYICTLILAYTGLRIGELCALKWKDIDFEEKTLSVTKTLYNPRNNYSMYKLLPPKTKKSRRTIDIDDIVIEELKTHRAKEVEFHMSKRNTYHDKNFVITNHRYPGYPETVQNYQKRMAILLKKAKLNQSLTPHSLRHTHTSLMAEAGATLPEIMERLGHADDEVTKKIYLHVTKAAKKKTSLKFSALMRSIKV